jgi:hypothetical protein
LWFLLRAVPPAPVRLRFPGVILLQGLVDKDPVLDRTPWWLILLRILALAAVIIGLAGPELSPEEAEDEPRAPLVLLLDGSWVGAVDWSQRVALAEQVLLEADRNGRLAVVMSLSDPQPVSFQPAGDLVPLLEGVIPQPWQPTSEMLARGADLLAAFEEDYETFWISDAVEYPGREALIAQLEARGRVTVIEGEANPVALYPVEFHDGEVVVRAVRRAVDLVTDDTLRVWGLDPSGQLRILETHDLHFENGEVLSELRLSLPSDLRGRLRYFDLMGQASAGAMVLTDDSLRRREVAIVTGRQDQEGLELLSPLQYLTQALSPTADLLFGALDEVIPANPDVIILPDVAAMTAVDEGALIQWVEAGGLLLRFAGPRLAASDLSRHEEHPLMPVRLRSGGRMVGGAMSWGAPKTLAPFKEDSPFYGLNIPDEVEVFAQVVAQPDPTLSDRVIAELNDGTPLVTRKYLGQGRVVLVHVTANAEWSSLLLSILFVQMLDRLAVSSVVGQPGPVELVGTTWQPHQIMDGFGGLKQGAAFAGVSGERVLSAPLGPDLYPGLYQGQNRSLARNVMQKGEVLQPATWPDSVVRRGMARPVPVLLGGYFLLLALGLLMLDVMAALTLSGRLHARQMATPKTHRSMLNSGAMVAVLSFCLTPLLVQEGQAQSARDDLLRRATAEVALAYVTTGNVQVDQVSDAGLRGLSDVLFFRTSVEPSPPVAVDLERDELALFPFLYWPIDEAQPLPSTEAYRRLNRYLRSGGVILFDTRDGDLTGYGVRSPQGRKLQKLAEPLDIPALEPIPADHVLTRTFYLLQDFPGRYRGRAGGGDVWVEAAPVDAEQVEGMPFRNLNDGVTPVVIGGNDWAAAWAVDEAGRAMFPVGRGRAGERQRELAYRFGINLVMHVLTGNYKSDQVHVPALLDRLGQ